MSEPKFPAGKIMIEDSEQPGVYVRDELKQDELDTYDKWLWNDQAKQELADLEAKLAAYINQLNIS